MTGRAALGYFYPTPPTGAGADGCFDWKNNLCYFLVAAPSGNGPFMWTFEAGTRQAVDSIDLTTFPFIVNNKILCSGLDGRVYFSQLDPVHLIVGYNPQNRSEDKVYVDTGGLVGALAQISAFQEAGTNYIAGSSLGSGGSSMHGSQVAIVNTDTLLFAHAFTVNEPGFDADNNAFNCQGNGFVCVAATDGFVIGFYTADSTTNTRLGGVTSASLDGSTQYNNVFRPGYDKPNNAILVMCTTSNGNTYLLSFSIGSGSLNWKLALSGGMDLNDVYCIAGRLHLVAPSGTPANYYDINTTAGTITHTEVETTLPNNGEIGVSNDLTDITICNVQAVAGVAQWYTFGPPPPPPNYGGGVLRSGC